MIYKAIFVIEAKSNISGNIAIFTGGEGTNPYLQLQSSGGDTRELPFSTSILYIWTLEQLRIKCVVDREEGKSISLSTFTPHDQVSRLQLDVVNFKLADKSRWPHLCYLICD